MSNFGIKASKLKRNPMLKIIEKLLIAFIIIYVLICLAAVFFQEKLIFPRQKLSDDAITVSTRIDDIEDIELKMKDGNKMRGWFVKNSISEKSNLLIYFGANAEEVSRIIPRMSKFQNWSVVLINYRGYGKSEGTPSEQTLFSDSLEIYDYFANREDINKSNIILMGRSIGTGVATYLAEKRNTSAVILVSPYDTLGGIVKEKCPILPVNLILKHRFDSISRAPSIKSPLLIIVGTEDKLIPIWHSRRLGEAWGGKVSFEKIIGEGHNSIDDGEEYWNKINKFLTEKDSSTSVQ